MRVIIDDDGNIHLDSMKRKTRAIREAIARKEAEYVTRISLAELRALNEF